MNFRSLLIRSLPFTMSFGWNSNRLWLWLPRVQSHGCGDQALLNKHTKALDRFWQLKVFPMMRLTHELGLQSEPLELRRSWLLCRPSPHGSNSRFWPTRYVSNSFFQVNWSWSFQPLVGLRLPIAPRVPRRANERSTLPSQLTLTLWRFPLFLESLKPKVKFYRRSLCTNLVRLLRGSSWPKLLMRSLIYEQPSQSLKVHLDCCFFMVLKRSGPRRLNRLRSRFRVNASAMVNRSLLMQLWFNLDQWRLSNEFSRFRFRWTLLTWSQSNWLYIATRLVQTGARLLVHLSNTLCSRFPSSRFAMLRTVDVLTGTMMRRSTPPVPSPICGGDSFFDMGSSMFSVCVRVPRCLLDKLLSCSGVGGIYSEPRTPDAKLVDPAYVVVWMPKMDRAELAHQRQMNPSAVGIARVGDRRGLRVLSSNAPSLHASLRPGSTFLPQGPRLSWLVGPMPYGTDRVSLTKALTSLPWQVKVLQPSQNVPGRGTLWSVQSVEEPPVTIIPMNHGDAVVTRQRPTESETKIQVPKPVAASDTLALCGKPKPDPPTAKGATPDPLVKHDPWGSWSGSSLIPARRSPDVDASLQQIETKIHDAVMAKLPVPPQGSEDMPARLQSLESQFQGLLSRQQQLEKNVQDSSVKHTQEIQQLTNHLQSQVEHQQQSMAAMFEAQMSQIRGLLSKRPRSDTEDMNLWSAGRTGSVIRALLCLVCFLAPLVWVCRSEPFEFTDFLLVGCVLCCISFALGMSSRRVKPVHSRLLMPHFGFGTLSRSVLLLLCFRFGEASHPGPPPNAGMQFSVGICNPSGLPNKAMIVHEHMSDVDLWLVSETHLSEAATHRFKQGLQCANSAFKYCVGGYPVAKRHHSKLAGQWNGVAVLSKFPTKAVPHAWSDFVHKSSRVQITSTLIHNLWLTAGTIYGESIGPTHPNHIHHNEMLVRAVASQIAYQCVGPRVIGGDWNVEDGEIPSFQFLRDAGFVEAQDVAAARWGRSVQRTCKMATRKDFLFLSPELVALLVDVRLRSDVWADHVTIEAKFCGNIQSVPRYVWRRPQACSWPSGLDLSQIDWPVSGSLESQYHATWSAIEKAAVSQSQVPVPSRMLGRGKPVQLKRVVGVVHAPLNAGRQGDVAPHFHGISLHHSRWFRQLRKLQELCRLLRSKKVDALEDRVRCAWGSIRRSPGFCPDFATWWLTCHFKVNGAPQVLPVCPPDVISAAAIHASFCLAVRDLEQQLKKQCTGYAKLRRALQPNLVFQDIRPAAAEGVNLLLKPCQATVIQIDPESFQVTLSQDCPWDVQCPVFANGFAVSILHHEAEDVWLESVDHLAVGDLVTQVTRKGHVDDLCREFRQTWQERWHRHKHVPSSQWSQILQFAQVHLKKTEHAFVPFDLAAFDQELRCRKTKTAAGMDGVHLSDLRLLPVGARGRLCKFYECAEQFGRWPQQLLNGSVSLLAKTDSPQDALGFRPITVLSLMYRLWSSFHAKSILSSFDVTLPDLLFGSRPGRHAGQVWSELCWLIEVSHIEGVPLSGVQADLQKAFNCLPRGVIMASALLMGVPFEVVKGWSAALAGFARFFRIRESYSDPVDSFTGFAEGCALSCVSMVITNALFHHWYEATMPEVCPVSYVDDWQLLTSNADHVARSITHLDDLCKQLDLMLDKGKTFSWSIHPDGRKCLHRDGLRVVKSAKILGAQAQFTLQVLSQAMQQRVESVLPLFERLRMSQSPYSAKLRAIRTAAWPKGLHGCLAVRISASTFSQLRTAAMRGLQAEGSGVNPSIHLGLLEHPMVDPAFWATMTSLRQTRDCGNPELVESLLAGLAWGHCEGPSNGITTTLLHRINALGWGVTLEGRVHDRYGTFSLFQIHPDELLLRMRTAWLNVVSSQVKGRQDLDSLHLADVRETLSWIRVLPLADKALVRKILNGAIFTAEYQSKWDAHTSSECPFCFCTDSRFHRWWECEALESARGGFTDDLRSMIHSLPKCLTSFGWALQPNTLHAWRQRLAQIPHPEVPTRGPEVSVVDVFTDGGCWWPQDADVRIASWSIIQALPDNHQLQPVVASGVLPGLIQNAFRAELFACKVALAWAVKFQVGIRLWVDCLSVVRKFQRLQREMRRPKVNSRHSDLWCEVFDLLCQLGTVPVSISKVDAHVQPDSCGDAQAKWCAIHNAHADRIAALANHGRPPEFWAFHTAHVANTHATRDVSRRLQAVQLSVSRLVVQRERRDPEDDTVQQLPAKRPQPADPEWAPLPDIPAVASAIDCKYGGELSSDLRYWFWAHANAAARPCWVSLYQLYIDFMGFYGYGGPINVNHRWVDVRSAPEIDVVPFHFKKRCSWWSCAFRAIMKAGGAQLASAFCRPNSYMLCVHTTCFWVPWPSERLQVIDKWLASHLPHPATRNGDSLVHLPAYRGPKELVQVVH